MEVCHVCSKEIKPNEYVTYEWFFPVHLACDPRTKDINPVVLNKFNSLEDFLEWENDMLMSALWGLE